MDDPKVVHDVLGLRGSQSISDEGRGISTYGVYEEASEDSVPQAGLWFALLILVWAVNLFEVAYQNIRNI